MATGDKLVNLDELKLVYDKLHVPSVQVQIPTGQWSGSSTRTYTVNATNVTADTIVDWAMDSSINYLKADLTVTPGSGTIQFSTTAIPAGTINVTLFFPGVNGEVVIQTLADVYSKSQVDQKISQSTAWSNNWLTNTSILAYAASVADPSFTTFRTSATSTDVPIANEYYIGTVERYGQNITVNMTTMQDASKMYINNSVNGGSTWTGWKTFLDSQSMADVVWEADKNSSYYGIIDPDNYTTNGFYQVGINTDGYNRYGILLVFVGNGGHVQQLFLSNYALYARSKNSASSEWTTWRSIEPANRSYTVNLLAADDTIAEIAEKLYALPVGQTATITCDTTPAKMLTTNGSTTNPKVAEAIYGTVYRRSSDLFRFMVRIAVNSMIIVFSASVTSSSITTPDIYKFNGTAL